MNSPKRNIYSKVIATGSYSPKRIVSNDDLAKMIDTSDQWIQSRTGIKQRHFVEKYGEKTSDLAYFAAKEAFDLAGIKPNDVDLLIVATTTADKRLPATACIVANKFNITSSTAFDVHSACSGLIYALSVADLFIQTGKSRRALVIGAETMSTLMNMKDRTTCVLFGDGAGAFLLEASKTAGIIDTQLHAMPEFISLLEGREIEGKEYLTMQGKEVFKVAVKELCEMAPKILKDNGFQTSELDWFVPHQANIRIIDAVAKKLNIPNSKVITIINKFGNTSAASIGQAYDYASRKNYFKSGDLVLLEAFGAGFSWGSALLKI